MTRKEWAEYYFVYLGMMPPKELRTEKWVLHHKDPSWKTDDPERYEKWDVHDLIPMTQAEHNKVHKGGIERPQEVKDKISKTKQEYFATEESNVTRQKMSEAHKGLYDGENNSNYGKHASGETRQKISEKTKGRTPWNKGRHGVQEAWNKGLTKAEMLARKEARH